MWGRLSSLPLDKKDYPPPGRLESQPHIILDRLERKPVPHEFGVPWNARSLPHMNVAGRIKDELP
jgi:hypothetical protein